MGGSAPRKQYHLVDQHFEGTHGGYQVQSGQVLRQLHVEVAVCLVV